MKRALLPVLFGLVLSGQALAGPLAQFDSAYRGMYARYRTALFATNAGDPAKAAQALRGFAAAWSGFADSYGPTPPAILAEDTAWPQTLAKVGHAVSGAQAQVLAGSLPQAHETLEEIRDLLGDMHDRNGIQTYSDRMNAYHARMETTLALDMSQPDAPGLLREQAAVLDYLARDLLASPPPEAAGNSEYDTLAAAFAASVDALIMAARGGDPAAMKSALAGLKKPYAMLFVRFG